MTRSMRAALVPSMLPLMMVLWLGAPLAHAQPAAAGDEARNAAKRAAKEASRAEALELLKRTSDFIAQKQNFSMKVQTGHDVLQFGGLMLEFGGELEIAVRRPNHMRVEFHDREGDDKITTFDGTTLSVLFPDENAYVSVEKPGSLDEILDYKIGDLGAPLPLADIIGTSMYEDVADRVELGLLIGDATVAGHECQHVVYRTPGIDFQMWIAKGDVPVPYRIVITHSDAEGAPQFWAQFEEWRLDDRAPDEAFVFSPPEGAERLTVRAPAVGGTK